MLSLLQVVLFVVCLQTSGGGGANAIFYVVVAHPVLSRHRSELPQPYMLDLHKHAFVDSRFVVGVVRCWSAEIWIMGPGWQCVPCQVR